MDVEDDIIDMDDDLKMTVSLWKLTVSIWDILSLWAEYAHHVTASQSGTSLKKQEKDDYHVWNHVAWHASAAKPCLALGRLVIFTLGGAPGVRLLVEAPIPGGRDQHILPAPSSSAL